MFRIMRPIYVASSNGLQGAEVQSAPTAKNTDANHFS